MANGKFQFKLLTGDNPDSQYAAITTHDPLTFYLLGNGKGYLGDTPLFGDSAIEIIQALSSSTGTNSNVPSSKAVMNYVEDQIDTKLGGKFLRLVGSHTLTAEDIANENIICEEGCAAGDPGLMFLSDNDNTDNNGGEKYYFVSLKAYLQTVHTFINSNAINMTVDSSNQVKSSLNLAPDNNGIVFVDTNGIHVRNTYNKEIGKDYTDENRTTVFDPAATASNTLVTEATLIKYVASAVAAEVQSQLDVAGVVTYTQEPVVVETTDA